MPRKSYKPEEIVAKLRFVLRSRRMAAAQPRPAPAAMLPVGAKAELKLTFQLDQQAGAGQSTYPLKDSR